MLPHEGGYLPLLLLPVLLKLFHPPVVGLHLLPQDGVLQFGRVLVETRARSQSRIVPEDARRQEPRRGLGRSAERARITAALERIDEGEWGYCLKCGEEIAEKRLRHDPSVANCVKCASGMG